MSKVIVITGAAVGLGRALARRFVQEGEHVVLLGRTFEKLAVLARELGERALAVQCDVASAESVRRAFTEIKDRHQHIDVLVNNAAVYEPFLLAEATDEQITSAIQTNVCGPMFCARAAIPLMSPGSHIINVGSESVDSRLPHLVVYQTSKAALERFTIGLHHELESSGIRVSAVRAGAMMEEGKVFNADPAALKRFHQAATEAGYNLRERPISQFASATNVFRSLIDLPDDLHAVIITLHPRKRPQR